MCLKQTVQKHTTLLQLFPIRSPFETVEMDFLGPLLKSLNCNQFLLVTTDLHSKVASPVLTSETAALHIQSSVMFNWEILSGIPTHVWKNGTKFLSKLFDSIHLFLATKHWAPTAYHPETNRHAQTFQEQDNWNSTTLSGWSPKGKLTIELKAIGIRQYCQCKVN